MVYKNFVLTILFCFALSYSFAQIITKEGSDYQYQNSTYSKTELEDILMQNVEAKDYYDRFISKRQYAKDGLIAGTLLIAIGGGYAIYKYKKGCQGGPCIGEIVLGIGIGLIGVIIDLFALVNEVRAYKNLHHAIDTFNENKSIGNINDSQLHLSATNNGISLTIAF